MKVLQLKCSFFQRSKVREIIFCLTLRIRVLNSWQLKFILGCNIRLLDTEKTRRKRYTGSFLLLKATQDITLTTQNIFVGVPFSLVSHFHWCPIFRWYPFFRWCPKKTIEKIKNFRWCPIFRWCPFFKENGTPTKMGHQRKWDTNESTPFILVNNINFATFIYFFKPINLIILTIKSSCC